MDARITWPEFRIPPINLWVMPGWSKAAGIETRPHRIANLHRAIAEHRRLLAIRGGRHGNQD